MNYANFLRNNGEHLTTTGQFAIRDFSMTLETGRAKIIQSSHLRSKRHLWVAKSDPFVVNVLT